MKDCVTGLHESIIREYLLRFHGSIKLELSVRQEYARDSTQGCHRTQESPSRSPGKGSQNRPHRHSSSELKKGRILRLRRSLPEGAHSSLHHSFSPLAIALKSSRTDCRSSAISSARMTGSGRLSESSRLSSLSQKMSRL